jgi:hypothetical protein
MKDEIWVTQNNAHTSYWKMNNGSRGLKKAPVMLDQQTEGFILEVIYLLGKKSTSATDFHNERNAQ